MSIKVPGSVQSDPNGTNKQYNMVLQTKYRTSCLCLSVKRGEKCSRFVHFLKSQQKLTQATEIIREYMKPFVKVSIREHYSAYI